MKPHKTSLTRERICTLACSFLLPALLMAAVLAVSGIYPFGEKSLLIIDMNSEYVDYLAQLNESLRTGQSLMRSWNMGMGLNMLGLIAFYTSSPFNILVMLFPVEVITEVLFVITLLKIGLAGLLFALYTEYVFGRRGVFAVIFAVAYALMAYNIAYASNIMWLDGTAMLPLVLLGAERILREDKWGVFLFSLVYVFFSSYYIGYMIGVFSFLYFTAVYFSKARPVRAYWRKLGRFVFTAALAAGCCAFLLVPAFLNLRNGQSNLWDVPISFTLERSMVRIASRLLPGVYDTLTDAGLPNVYCTALGVLLCVLFFTHKGIARREKLVLGGVLSALILGLSCNFLYLAWHAFEDPTWFPARFSFVVSFFVLFLAMKAAEQLPGISLAGMAGGVGLLTVLFVEIGIQRFSYMTAKTVVAGIALLLVYALLLTGIFRRNKRWMAVVVLVLVCTEAFGNAYIMERELDNQFQYKTRESYTAYREKYLPAVQQVQSMDSGVYRMEILEQRNANGGMALGYNGISHYSTTTDQELNKFLRRLTYNKGTTNELRFAVTTPATNGLLGIRYVLADSDPGSGYTALDPGIYRNASAFPLAFWAGNDALRVSGMGDNPFVLQNTLFHALGADVDVFLPVEDIEENLHNVDMEQKDGYIEYTPRVKSEPAAVEFQLHNPSGREVYAYFPVWKNKFAAAKILVDGNEVQRDLAYRKNSIVPLGSGEDIVLTLELSQSVTRIADQLFYSLDQEAAEAVAGRANQNAMQFDRFSDTAVHGTVAAPESGVLVTTFPFDTGWHITVDGESVQPLRFADVFIALPMAPGAHTIAMRYYAPGFVPGCIVSAVCVAGLLGWLLWSNRKRAKA